MTKREIGRKRKEDKETKNKIKFWDQKSSSFKKRTKKALKKPAKKRAEKEIRIKGKTSKN